jgi:tRNA (guanine-N7-)-methyltransferase
MSIPSFPKRLVRSFVRRDSRLTDAQAEAYTTLWPQYGLEMQAGMLDYQQVFGRLAPCILEIGFGSGESLLAMAKAHPEKNFIGIEVHKPGIGGLLLGIQVASLTNIRIYHHDAVEVLTHCIPAESVDGVQLFFPDPWPKRRHHKRRLIQPKFIDQLIAKLKPAGILHLATDWEDYAHHMVKVLTSESRLMNLAGEKIFSHRSAHRPIVTKFERRSQQEGRPVWELQFAKR